MQREKKGSGGPGLVWMSPQSAKIETRRGRWSDVNRDLASSRGRRRWFNCDVANQLVCNRVGAGLSIRELQRLVHVDVLAGPIVATTSVSSLSQLPAATSCVVAVSPPTVPAFVGQVINARLPPCTAGVNATFEGWGCMMDRCVHPCCPLARS